MVTFIFQADADHDSMVILVMKLAEQKKCALRCTWFRHWNNNPLGTDSYLHAASAPGGYFYEFQPQMQVECGI